MTWRNRHSVELSIRKMNENKKLLVSNGYVSIDNLSDEEIESCVGNPFWLYPHTESTFVSPMENSKIDRKRVFDLKINVLETLKSTDATTWREKFYDLLGEFSATSEEGKFYLRLDRIYANQALMTSEFKYAKMYPAVTEEDEDFDVILPDITSDADLPVSGCSGGLSDVVEMAYPFYESLYFEGAKNFVKFFGGSIPKDQDGLQRRVEELGYINVGKNLKQLQLELKSFRRHYSSVVDGCLGIHELKHDPANGFKFYDEIKRSVDFFFESNSQFSNIKYCGEIFRLTDDEAKIINVLYLNYINKNNEPMTNKELAFELNGPSAHVDMIDKFRIEDDFRDTVAQKQTGKGRVTKPYFFRLIEKLPAGSVSESDNKKVFYRLRVPFDSQFPQKNQRIQKCIKINP